MMTDFNIPAYREWMEKHKSCSGKVTSAFFGLQWAASKQYISIRCGCGERFRMKTPTSDPIIDNPGDRYEPFKS